MVMEIPETVISTRQVNEYELQSFNKVSLAKTWLNFKLLSCISILIGIDIFKQERLKLSSSFEINCRFFS